MTHSHDNGSKSETLRSALAQAQELADCGHAHTTSSWETARHVGDLSALAALALAHPDTFA